MPAQYRTRKKTQKKKVYVKKKKVSPMRTLSYGFPDRYTCKHRYSDYIKLSQFTQGLPTTVIYNCNDLWDPRANAVGGGQPLHRDELTNVYQRYLVNGSRIVVEIATSSINTGTIAPILCVLTKEDTQDNISSYQSLTYLMERKASTYKELNENRKVVLHSSYSAKQYNKKTLGRDGNTLHEDLYGISGSVPIKGQKWYISVMSLDSASTAPDLYVTIRIEYNVTWSDRVVPVES